jgi:biotin synthase-like enzyme
MSFDKEYPNRKDHIKLYRKSKLVDRTCRCHGSCHYCYSNRTHSTKVREDKARFDLDK